MAVTLTRTKSKAAAKKAVKPLHTIEKQVERVADLVSQIETIKLSLSPLEKELLGLLTHFRTLGEEYAADQPVVFEGVDHTLELSEKPEQREITSMKKVRDLLGDKTFMEVVSVALKDIDRYLSEQEKEAVIKKERTGTRRYKVVEKG